MIRTKQSSCFGCSRKRVMAALVRTEEWRAHHKKMNSRALEANTKDPVYVALRRRCNSAKARCCTTTDRRYPYYGGRGIEFRFSSPVAMAEWVLEYLGPPPAGCSVDREDNNGHYEPGNLRWATAKTQNNNKREYAVGDYGARVRLMREARPDYSEQNIRALIRSGLTDEEIVNRRKWDGCGRYIRHS